VKHSLLLLLAAIILSLEAVFAVLGGWLLLGETLSIRKDMGALIMLTGLIFEKTPGVILINQP